VNLRKERKRQGLTITALARKAKVPYSTLQSIEVGRLEGSLRVKDRLATALKVPIWLLLSNAELRIIAKVDVDLRGGRA